MRILFASIHNYLDPSSGAFAGTDFNSWDDVETDINNFLGGPTQQYDYAFEIGGYIHDNYSDIYDAFVFTGHSLGGGLASCCSIVAHPETFSVLEPYNTYTFNAASLNVNAIRGSSYEHQRDYVYAEGANGIREGNFYHGNSFVWAFILRGDPVDLLQSRTGNRAYGHIQEIRLAQEIEDYYLTNYSIMGIMFHLMDSVMVAMERQHNIL